MKTMQQTNPNNEGKLKLSFGSIWSLFLLLLKGVVAGFGAIMPGISGGALCVAFGMYNIILSALSNPFKTLKKHGVKIIVFALGIGIGFVGLAGLAEWLMELNMQAIICVFMGFILGTVPDLWHTAGEKGRSRSSYATLSLGFGVMLTVLVLLRVGNAVTITSGIGAFLFCGVVWGVSFVVPGLSSSTLLLFFGLYQPMLEGISSFSMRVLIPLAIGLVACILALPKAVNALYNKWYSGMSHLILGVVLASTASIFPIEVLKSAKGIITALLCICLAAVASFFAGKLCTYLENKARSKTEGNDAQE